MKSNTKKRLIAFMLCMVLVLSSTISAFADEPQNTDSQSQAEVVTEPTADEPQNTDSQSQAEVVTEPAADEATEDTTTEDVSDTPDIEIPSKKEWSVQVGNEKENFVPRHDSDNGSRGTHNCICKGLSGSRRMAG